MPFANALAKGHDGFMSDEVHAPHSNDLAERAVGAAASALGVLKRFMVDYDADAPHAAWQVLHEAGRSSVAAASDEETWVRQAALMLLVGLETVSRDAGPDGDMEGTSEQDDDASGQVEEAWRLLALGDLAGAESLSNELVRPKADEDDGDARDVGDAVHHGHLILGHISLRRGNEGAAEEHLLAAASVSPSPVLASFGPNMSLARELLRQGRQEAVLAYFERCASFWGPLVRWSADVRQGIMPDFGPNLIYGLPDDVQEEIAGSA
jgi:hypothetical protein